MSQFDPFTQNITILMPNGNGTGTVPFNISIPTIDHSFYYAVSVSMCYGFQIGACMMMLLMVLLLTKRTKYKSPVFILNVVALAMAVASRALLAVFFLSSWYEFYASSTSDWSRVTDSAKATSVASAIVPLLITILVNSSLVLQTRAVVIGVRPLYRHGIIAISVLVLLVAVGFRFTEMVTNVRAILYLETFDSWVWLIKGSLAAEMISIWFFCSIFTAKLVATVVARKKLGLPPWNPMYVLAVAGGCTMFVPGIFAIVECINPPNFPEAGSLAVITVVILLPLSSLWAQSNTVNQSVPLNIQQQLWASNSSRGVVCTCGGKSTNMSMFPSSGTSATYSSVVRTGHHETPRRDSTDADLESMGVRVHRTFSVRSA
ncbi:uncharacterized protein BP5553_03466 [Venustampulla echinocandica]|uniref:Pheromone receptor n=1 Tax=Venustampulla echinocandica TaxID=2656787 RepID=A0A370TUC9_9HELO|nr:uncharacterized protein BP5553_03466 [Venustampulla echinocandica]RDL39126.1 hypothetical protein BP5553_03466 [Venustampulla echinocandica]